MKCWECAAEVLVCWRCWGMLVQKKNGKLYKPWNSVGKKWSDGTALERWNKNAEVMENYWRWVVALLGMHEGNGDVKEVLRKCWRSSGDELQELLEMHEGKNKNADVEYVLRKCWSVGGMREAWNRDGWAPRKCWATENVLEEALKLDTCWGSVGEMLKNCWRYVGGPGFGESLDVSGPPQWTPSWKTCNLFRHLDLQLLNSTWPCWPYLFDLGDVTHHVLGYGAFTHTHTHIFGVVGDGWLVLGLRPINCQGY